MALSVEILRYHDDIGTIFDELNNLMKELPNNYRSPSCTTIISQYNALKSQYPNVKSNLRNYSRDLQNVVKFWEMRMKKAAVGFNEAASETQQSIKSEKEIIPNQQSTERRI
ncbi:hypothetical protein IKE98_00800 [Candidatus Saccharibacteria bacterium]|nr:hypothetical protein [Candidatus Saccharibacteria bacterium]